VIKNMNYEFDEEIIYDDKAMWALACAFKCNYDFIKEQVERSQKNKPCSSVIYEGKVVMQWDVRYKKILSDYKKELKFMNNLLESKLKQKDKNLKKYIKVDA